MITQPKLANITVVSVALWWCLLFPFDHALIGQILNWIRFPFEQTLLLLDPNLSFETDTTGTYLLSLLAGILGIATTFMLPERIKLFFTQHANAIIAFILAVFYLEYAWVKIFPVQFLPPESNVLHTPLGQLSKDIAFWSLMGSTYILTCFIGIIELLTGFGLLLKRTRMVASLFGFGIASTLLVLNLSFDISVKLLSLCLFLLNTWLVSTYWAEIKALFNTKKQSFKAVIISMIVVLLTGIPAFMNSLKTNPLLKINGAYFLPESGNIRYVHIHASGYLIFENDKGAFEDFKMISENNTSFQLVDAKNKSVGTLKLLPTPHLVWHNKSWVMKRAPESNYTLLEHSFHFTADEFH